MNSEARQTTQMYTNSTAKIRDKRNALWLAYITCRIHRSYCHFINPEIGNNWCRNKSQYHQIAILSYLSRLNPFVTYGLDHCKSSIIYRGSGVISIFSSNGRLNSSANRISPDGTLYCLPMSKKEDSRIMSRYIRPLSWKPCLYCLRSKK